MGARVADSFKFSHGYDENPTIVEAKSKEKIARHQIVRISIGSLKKHLFHSVHRELREKTQRNVDSYIFKMTTPSMMGVTFLENFIPEATL